MPDGRTIKQTQPFARCTPEYGTSRCLFGDEELYGPGYYGAHGGSGLSCIGGTLRVGELVPGAGPIRHVLKVNLYAARNLHYDDETRGYRWPARIRAQAFQDYGAYVVDDTAWDVYALVTEWRPAEGAACRATCWAPTALSSSSPRPNG